MRTLLLLLQLLGYVWVLLLPGVLVALPVRAGWSPGVRVLVGASLGMLAMPMLCFSAACLVGKSITPALAVTVATIVNGVAGAVFVVRRRGEARAPVPSAPPGLDG